MSLRVAHVTATFPPYTGGTGNVCYHNARELARRGHEVHVFTAATMGKPSLEECENFTVHRLRRVIQFGNMPVLPGLVSSLQGFDIIHLHYPFILGAEFASLAASRFKIPLVVSFHNDLIGNGPREFFFKLYQNISAQLTVRSAARLCAVSTDHFRFSRLHRMLASNPLKRASNTVKIEELPNGVDLCRFSPVDGKEKLRGQFGIPQHGKLALFVAALDRAHHFKGLSLLLQAMQSLPPEVWLLVIGDGDMRKNYQQEAGALGLSDRVIFTGEIQHEKLPPFFSGADVTILPSLPPESFGLVLIESQACGTPVIASRLPGVRTVVNHGMDGLLVDPQNRKALAAAMLNILSNDILRQSMGKKGRLKVEDRYSWDQIGQRLEKIYQEVLMEEKNRTESDNHKGHMRGA